jgi:protocatechuate 3,4-dioxygenase beta subunit
MLKPRLTILVLTLLCWLHFDYQSQAQTNETKAGTSTVSGKVTLKGEPVRGVLVSLLLQQQFGRPNQNTSLRAKTDTTGNFRITGVPAGRYFISALAPAYVTQSQSQFNQMGKSINIGDGENIENFDFALKLGGVITGRITSSNSQPLVEENVRLWRVDEGGKPQPFHTGYNYYMYRTDDRGIYRLYGLPSGRYLVSAGISQKDGTFAVGSGRYYPQTYHPDVTNESQAKVIELSEGDEVTGIDISIGEAMKSFHVYGRVVDVDSGQPVTGIQIQHGSYLPGDRGLGGYGSMGERSGEQGEFRLQGIVPGKYGVFASLEGSSDYYSEITPFEITDSDVSGLEVKVRRGGSISGVVAIEGTNDPSIITKFQQLGLSAHTITDGINIPPRGITRINPDGGFRIKGLRPGKVQISVVSPGGDRRFTFLRIERGGVIQREGIEVGPGEQITNARVFIGYGTAVLRGGLKISGAALPEGSMFYLRASLVEGTAMSGTGSEVDVRGNFVLENLMPGPYELRLTIYNRTNPRAVDQALMRKVSQFKQIVNVGSGGDTQINLTLDLSREENER